MIFYHQIVALIIFHLTLRSDSLNITCDYLNKSNDIFNIYILRDYSSISDLKFTCSYRYGFKSGIPSSSILIFKSTKSFIFDSTIDFNQLYIEPGSSMTLRLYNFQGFQLNTVIFKNIFNYSFVSNIDITIGIILSNYEFYNKNKEATSICLLRNFSYNFGFSPKLYIHSSTRFSKKILPIDFQ